MTSCDTSDNETLTIDVNDTSDNETLTIDVNTELWQL